MATVSTWHRCSQSANSCRFCVNVGNDRTDSLSRSAGTATKISVAPRSIPPAFGLISGRLRSNLRCFLLFGLAMARLRFVKYGNEPGVPDMEISQAGSSQQKNCCCVSPMLLRTGLGSNSSTGSQKQSTNGVTTYAYRCRFPSSTTGEGPDWTHAKVPYCYWPGPPGRSTPQEEGNFSHDALYVQSLLHLLLQLLHESRHAPLLL